MNANKPHNFQPIAGRSFSFMCYSCGKHTYTDKDGRADLNGPAFVAYYCGKCAKKITEESEK